MPISKTFFSNNAADFALREGVPTKYKQETDGEVVALLKLPADVIGAYFAAIGTLFDSFKKTDNSETEAIAASLKLEMERKKYEQCIAAIQSDNTEKIKELACQ